VAAAAPLWGAGDFTRTIGLAVEGRWDTDCNGATAGSIFGVMFGARAIPSHWVDPLQDRIRSAIVGFDDSRISDLVERTLALAGRRRQGLPQEEAGSR
jgi:ADP-ribosylglycohydrolase